MRVKKFPAKLEKEIDSGSASGHLILLPITIGGKIFSNLRGQCRKISLFGPQRLQYIHILKGIIVFFTRKLTNENTERKKRLDQFIL